jgi:uncharacterized membrane protein
MPLHSAKGRSRKRKGVSTVVGTLFFVLVLFTAISFFVIMFNSFNNYTTTVKQMNEHQVQILDTRISITNFTFGSSSGTVTIFNSSPFAVHLVSLYIQDETNAVLYHFDTNSTAPGVSGSFDHWVASGAMMSVSESLSWTSKDNFSITVASDQGVLASFATTAP